LCQLPPAGRSCAVFVVDLRDASKHAEFIAELTGKHVMPPWKPVAGFGKFRDEHRLSEDKIKLIARWAAAGAPEGDPADLPEAPKFAEGWQLGEPDMVLQMTEAFDIPASGPDVYRCFVVPIPIEDDRMVSAVEFRPGTPSVVHHAIMFLESEGQARKRDTEDPAPGFESFGGPGVVPTGGLGAWAPGAVPRVLADGLGRYLRKGSDLVLQVHYHPTGKPEQDQSQIGLHFADKPVQKIVTGVAVVQPKLKIPAGAANHKVRAQSAPLPVDVYVTGISPHMHNLGREFKAVAVDPTGKKTAPLIWIKDWDFNWQGAYQFARPMRLPKGSIIRVEAVYDNSAKNPKNPNSPPKEVSWGEATSDEMCLCSVQVFTNTQDDLRRIASLEYYELAAGIEGGVPLADVALAKKGTPAAPPTGQVASTPAAPQAEGPPADSPPAETAVAATEPTDAAEKASAKKSADKKGKKKAEKVALDIPAGGVPIPPNLQPIYRGRADKDSNGILSREEIEALPENVRELTVDNLLDLQKKAAPAPPQ
jgi:hypothetical protein